MLRLNGVSGHPAARLAHSVKSVLGFDRIFGFKFDRNGTPSEHSMPTAYECAMLPTAMISAALAHWIGESPPMRFCLIATGTALQDQVEARTN